MPSPRELRMSSAACLTGVRRSNGQAPAESGRAASSSRRVRSRDRRSSVARLSTRGALAILPSCRSSRVPPSPVRMLLRS